MEKGLNILDYIIIFLISLTIISSVAIPVILYYNADTIECSMLGCTFTTEHTDMESRITSNCYINDVEVDCGNKTLNYIKYGKK